MNNICIIPARGGSKRILNKNIKLFNGFPIISWVINSAIQSKCFKHVIVSTDSEEIATISKKFGAKVPFKRPKKLADDFTTTLEVIKHSILEIRKNDENFDLVCCLYATAPLIEIDDLKKAVEITKYPPKKNFVFSATHYDYPIQRALTFDDNNFSTMIYQQHLNTRSQDLKETFHDAGQFYMGSMDSWLKASQNILEGSYPLLLPKWRVQDIDNEEDWLMAEFIHKLIKARVEK